MKTKLVYVLVSRTEDYFYEAFLMSLFSFRIYHPKDAVEVVMDTDTYQRLLDMKAKVLDDVITNVVEIPTEYNSMLRSRYLKTNLRKLVNGDFLYIDVDTIICGALNKIDQTNADMAMVADANNSIPFLGECKKVLAAGFKKPDDSIYYNGGVAFVKDTPISHRLYDEWFTLWEKSITHGVPFDQPALYQANKKLGGIIQELHGIYNWQIRGKLYYLLNVKILHYYMVNEWKQVLWRQIRREGRIDLITLLHIRFPRCFTIKWYISKRAKNLLIKCRNLFENILSRKTIH